MRKEALFEELQDLPTYSNSEAERASLMLEKETLLKKVKDTLERINHTKNNSKIIKQQNDYIFADIQTLKKALSKQKAEFFEDQNSLNKGIKEFTAINKGLEDKLVKLKLDYGRVAEEAEELKFTLEKVNESLKFKDFEISKLNQEIKRLNEGSDEIEAKPNRISLGSPRNPIMLLKKKK